MSSYVDKTYPGARTVPEHLTLYPGTYYLTQKGQFLAAWLFQTNVQVLENISSVCDDWGQSVSGRETMMLLLPWTGLPMWILLCPHSFKLHRRKWGARGCHGLHAEIIFREKCTTKITLHSQVQERKKESKTKRNTKSKKYVVYQTRVMDGIITMCSEQKPEWHRKWEIFYEDQMGTLNAQRIGEHTKKKKRKSHFEHNDYVSCMLLQNQKIFRT